MVRDGELVQQAVHLEQAEAEVQEEVFAEDRAVFKNVELPLLELVHDFEDVGPLARSHFNNLS